MGVWTGDVAKEGVAAVPERKAADLVCIRNPRNRTKAAGRIKVSRILFRSLPSAGILPQS